MPLILPTGTFHTFLAPASKPLYPETLLWKYPSSRHSTEAPLSCWQPPSFGIAALSQSPSPPEPCTHRASVMHQLKVSFRPFPLAAFGLQEVGRFAQMIVIEGCFESCIGGLGEHTLLFKDGENAHGLRREKRGGEREKHTKIDGCIDPLRSTIHPSWLLPSQRRK